MYAPRQAHVLRPQGVGPRAAGVTYYADDVDPGLSVELVAWPDRDYYDGDLGIDQGLWENGHCVRCDVEITSNAKRAFCPYCGSACALT